MAPHTISAPDHETSPSPMEDKMQQGTPNEKNKAAFSMKYAYEWTDDYFFEESQEERVERTAPGTKSSDPAQQSVSVLRPWAFNLRLERYVIMEVAWGKHHIAEITASEIIKSVKHHSYMRVGKHSHVPHLTYRDLKQIFAEGQRHPSLEVRQNCILVCLPPVSALVFHDRCAFHVNKEVDVDSLLVKLQEITAAFSKKADETREFFLTEYERYLSDTNAGRRRAKGSARTSRENSLEFSPPDVPAPQIDRRMLFDGDGHSQKQEQNERSVPRFVEFPLEFALLEILISHSLEYLNKDMESLELQAIQLKKDSDKGVQPPNVNVLKKLNAMKEPVSSFMDKTNGMNRAFDALLANEEDLSLMELTKAYYRPDLIPEGDVNPNLEIMIEFFDQELDQLLLRAQKIRRSLDNAHDYLLLLLSMLRSRLHVWEIAVGIVTCGFGVGAAISGAFGMNVINGWEESDVAFWVLVGMMGGFVLIASVILFRFKSRYYPTKEF